MAEQDTTQADWDAVNVERTNEFEALVSPPQDVESAEAPPTQEVAVDPYAGLSSDVRAKLERFDQMAATQTDLFNKLKETQGRVGALQSEFAKQRQAAEAPTQRQVAAAAKDPEKWAGLKNDFPEWGEGIAEFVESRIGAISQGQGLTAEQVEQAVALRTEALASDFQKALVEIKYETWEDEVKTPEFGAWFGAQRPEIQSLASSVKGKDALKMLDLFYESKKKPVADVRQTRQDKLAAAVTAKPGAPVQTKTFDDMSQSEQWNYLAEERSRKQRAEA
jgi:hypothetical protein